MARLLDQVLEGAYDNHVLPFLWMKGEDCTTITDYLEHIAAADIHEVCLESRPHPDFCGEGWWADVAFVIEECKRLGLKIWLLDDAHFPTGYANGLIRDRYPERRKVVLGHRMIDVAGPVSRMSIALGNTLDPSEEFVGAVAIREGEPVELPMELVAGDGAGEAVGGESADAVYFGTPQVGGVPDRLIFDAPEGTTRVCLIYTTRKSGFRDEYINMVDKVSCDTLIEAVYEPHYEHFADEFGRTIKGFFTDEPGFMNEKGAVDDASRADSIIGKAGQLLPWSVELERRLRERWGERFLSNLTWLWTRDAAGARARHDYMDVATALYRECFDENIGNWCRAHGVEHIDHVIEDKDSHARLGVGAGHYFRAVAGQDMAGVDIVINQLVPGIDRGLYSYGRGQWDMEFFTYALAKLGSSAAHLDPKKGGRCMAEVFGAFGWHEGLREMTWIANHMLVRGVNYFVPHAFSMAPFPDPDCPPHFYAHGEDPQYRHFGILMRYLNRMGTLLSGGEAHPVAAVLYHADAEWAGEAMPIQEPARVLAQAQIDFDFVPEDAFASDGGYTVELYPEERSFAVNGQRYRCLVLPRAAFAGAGTVAFARRAADAGIPVFAVDSLPHAAYDGVGSEAAGFAELGREALAGVRAVPLEGLAGAVAEAGITELAVAGVEPWLRACRYTHGTGDATEELWMFVNEHPHRGVRTRVAVRGAAGAFEPLVGVRHDVLNGGSSTCTGALELAPGEACLVAVTPAGKSGEGRCTGAATAVRTDALKVTGSWHVSYASARAYPTFDEEVELPVLTDLSGELFPGKSGTFRYRTTVMLDETRSQAVLDLGEVYETAEAWLDGRPLGVRIAPPYRFEAGELAPGEHELVVEVTNTLDHAVRDMFSLTVPSEPSGLLGPVRLIG